MLVTDNFVCYPIRMSPALPPPPPPQLLKQGICGNIGVNICEVEEIKLIRSFKAREIHFLDAMEMKLT